MKRGDLVKIIHFIDLLDQEDGFPPLYRIAVYLEEDDYDFYGDSERIRCAKVIDSDGRINHYPVDSFRFFEVNGEAR
jgi:hypothetical protein